jgi:predicted kinase
MEAVILIGIPASGKTTFYQGRLSATHIQINLDTLKTRARESLILQKCIAAGQAFAVDNTNITREQRARFILPARMAGYRVTGYFFEPAIKDILERNRQRKGKASIPAAGIFGTLKRMQLPELQEGFDELYHVSVSANGEFIVRKWIDKSMTK